MREEAGGAGNVLLGETERGSRPEPAVLPRMFISRSLRMWRERSKSSRDS